MPQWLEVFVVALRLGLTSFGGPMAHLGYFHREYVVHRRWLSEEDYAGVVALAQALPGPASSQVGMAVGYRRAGAVGALAAWLGFTLPSALVMAGLGWLWASGWGTQMPAGLLHGLELAALAVVTQAVWTMGRSLVKTWVQGAILIASVAVLLWWSEPAAPLVLLAAGALIGWGVAPARDELAPRAGGRRVPWSAVVALGLFFVLLFGLPWLGPLFQDAALADGFYRSGALVFGGGHVVLPLLQKEFVGEGLLSPQEFLAGYGLAQALPGPLFTLSAFLGFLLDGPWGALVAVTAIFLPSFLLVLGVLPLWKGLAEARWFRGALAGVNPVVVGLLAAAWFNPVALTAVRTVPDGLAATVLAALLLVLKAPPWLVVLLGLAAGVGLGTLQG